jgi:hypothetical protein
MKLDFNELIMISLALGSRRHETLERGNREMAAKYEDLQKRLDFYLECHRGEELALEVVREARDH